MTIEELYKLAIKKNLENTKIRITHICNNCDQHINYFLDEYQIWFDENKNEIIISV